ncbi:hypothetical protein [Flagellimonas lutimaris]|uniref:hypothetical protein n=1 Tax=Flagellimonas lutimaris TaxID=475082 RepID=UPI003F5CD7BF
MISWAAISKVKKGIQIALGFTERHPKHQRIVFLTWCGIVPALPTSVPSCSVMVDEPGKLSHPHRMKVSSVNQLLGFDLSLG